MPPPEPRVGWVVLVLAIGLAVALLVLAVGIFTSTRLTENETQVLTGWGGGIIAIVGGYIGYRVDRHRRNGHDDDDDGESS